MFPMIVTICLIILSYGAVIAFVRTLWWEYAAIAVATLSMLAWPANPMIQVGCLLFIVGVVLSRTRVTDRFANPQGPRGGEQDGHPGNRDRHAPSPCRRPALVALAIAIAMVKVFERGPALLVLVGLHSSHSRRPRQPGTYRPSRPGEHASCSCS